MSDGVGEKIVFGGDKRWDDSPVWKSNLVGLPKNLQGKVVVEFYSGSDKESIGSEVLGRGGRYVSVTLSDDNTHDVSFRGRAGEIVRGFEDNSVDYVVLYGPPWWEGNRDMGRVSRFSSIGVEQLEEVVVNSMRIIKKENGNFMAMGIGFSRNDFEKAREIVGKTDPGWMWSWEEVPEMGKDNRGESYGFIKIEYKKLVWGE